jgi:hypothetical protein
MRKKSFTGRERYVGHQYLIFIIFPFPAAVEPAARYNRNSTDVRYTVRREYNNPSLPLRPFRQNINNMYKRIILAYTTPSFLTWAEGLPAACE